MMSAGAEGKLPSRLRILNEKVCFFRRIKFSIMPVDTFVGGETDTPAGFGVDEKTAKRSGNRVNGSLAVSTNFWQASSNCQNIFSFAGVFFASADMVFFMVTRPEDSYKIHRGGGIINRFLRLFRPSERQAVSHDKYMKMTQTCQDNSRKLCKKLVDIKGCFPYNHREPLS